MKKKLILWIVSLVFGTGTSFAQETGSFKEKGCLPFEMLVDKCANGNKQSCKKLKSCFPSESKGKNKQKQYYSHTTAKPWGYTGWVIQQVEEIDSGFARELKTMSEKNPRKAGIVFGSVHRKKYMSDKKEIEQGKKDFIRLIKLNIEEYDIVEKYRKTSDEAQQNKFEKELTDVELEKFELRNKDIGSHIENMKSNISKIEKDFETRKANKQRIVKNRVDMLLGKSLSSMW